MCPVESNAAQIPGLGPKSCKMLADVGIKSVATLRQVGSVAAYSRVKQAGGRASLNLLWGLEAVITGIDWREIAREHRTRLLMMLDDHEQDVRTASSMSRQEKSGNETKTVPSVARKR